jgi:hypothetical protein
MGNEITKEYFEGYLETKFQSFGDKLMIDIDKKLDEKLDAKIDMLAQIIETTVAIPLQQHLEDVKHGRVWA